MSKLQFLAMLTLCCLGCIFSMFHRSSLLLLTPDISSALDLSSQEVGLLGAVYLYGFAIHQLPLGLMLARFGPRLVMSLSFVTASLGALCIGVAAHAWLALAGRFCMGIGMSASFMGSLALLAGWLPPQRFGVFSGLVAGAATLGGLMATTPLSYLSVAWGWRGVFIILALATVALAAGFWLLVRNPPGDGAVPNLKQSLKILLPRLSFWILGLASAARYGFFVAVQSTWAGPFLLWGMGLNQAQSARLMLYMILGYMLGMPLSGYISDYLQAPKLVVMLGLLGQALTALALLTLPGALPLAPLLAAFGLFSGPGILIYAHAKDILPAQVMAPALTWINFFTILAGGLLTQLMGYWLPSDIKVITGPHMFDSLWYAGIISLGAASVLYAFLPGKLRPAEQKSVSFLS
jgi:MFS family permease